MRGRASDFADEPANVWSGAAAKRLVMSFTAQLSSAGGAAKILCGSP